MDIPTYTPLPAGNWGSKTHMAALNLSQEPSNTSYQMYRQAARASGKSMMELRALFDYYFNEYWQKQMGRYENKPVDEVYDV